MEKYAKYAAAGLFLAFCATLAPWAFDFPLNDDWAYALAARALAESGRLALSDWGSSNQLPHLLSGALAAKIFGFGFGALRSATLLWTAGALFFFVRILERLQVPPAERLAAGLALGLNPLTLVLANSFMTDCHYLFWMLAACYFYIRALDNPEDRAAMLLAGACAAAAYLTRQIGLALPLAFTGALYFRRGLGARALARTWALPAAAMLGYWAWFRLVHGPTWASENYVGAATLAHLASPGPFLKESFRRLFASMLETGLLLLPLAAGYAFSAAKFCGRNGLRRKVSTAGVWLGAAALGAFVLFSGPLPYLENTFSATGLGPLTLGGAALKPSGFFASPLFWKAATGAAALSALFLMCASGLALRAGGAAPRFLAAACLLQLAMALAGAKFFDRYLLTLLPWFAAAAVFAARGVPFSRAAAGLALALYAAAGWAGMKDYLAWNAAKWELAARPRPGLEQRHIAAGFDHDAWLNYEPNMAYLKSMKPLKMIGEWEWQKVTPYRAMITYAPDPRFPTIDMSEYSTPLTSGKAQLYLLALPGH